MGRPLVRRLDPHREPIEAATAKEPLPHSRYPALPCTPWRAPRGNPPGSEAAVLLEELRELVEVPEAEVRPGIGAVVEPGHVRHILM